MRNIQRFAIMLIAFFLSLIVIAFGLVFTSKFDATKDAYVIGVISGVVSGAIILLYQMTLGMKK